MYRSELEEEDDDDYDYNNSPLTYSGKLGLSIRSSKLSGS